MRHIVPAAALTVALAGAAVLVARPLFAAESAREAVERLMPELMSDEDARRKEAEKELLGLGEPGRVELERVTRDSDPRRAVTALRLLQNPRWTKAPLKDGEERLRREDGRDPAPEDDGTDDLDELAGDAVDLGRRFHEQLQRQIEEMHRRFADLEQDFTFEMPDLDTSVRSTGASRGSVVENDRRTSWTIDAEGRVKVTIQDGKDAPETTYEAKSLAELRDVEPEIAARLDKAMPRTPRGFTFRFGRGGGLELDPGRARERADRGARDTATPVLGIEWSPMPDVLREHLDVRGVVVETVVPGSLAAKLGLTRHDVLVELQGRSVTGSTDVRAALDGVPAGETVRARIVRKGRPQDVETKR